MVAVFASASERIFQTSPQEAFASISNQAHMRAIRHDLYSAQELQTLVERAQLQLHRSMAKLLYRQQQGSHVLLWDDMARQLAVATTVALFGRDGAKTMNAEHAFDDVQRF